LFCKIFIQFPYSLASSYPHIQFFFYNFPISETVKSVWVFFFHVCVCDQTTAQEFIYTCYKFTLPVLQNHLPFFQLLMLSERCKFMIVFYYHHIFYLYFLLTVFETTFKRRWIIMSLNHYLNTGIMYGFKINWKLLEDLWDWSG
jgi:hypothetical protein